VPGLNNITLLLVPIRRLPRAREFFGVGWRGKDVLIYLNNLTNIQTSQGSPLRHLISFFFAKSKPKVRERIHSRSLELYKNQYGIDQEESITPRILMAVHKKIKPEQRYTFEDVLRLIFGESARAYQPEIEKFELNHLLDLLSREEILQHEINVVIKGDIIPALSGPNIQVSPRSPELRTALKEIISGKPVSRIEVQRIAQGLSEILESSNYRQSPFEMIDATQFFEMTGNAVRDDEIIELLEKAYCLGILSEFARGKGILPAEEWAALRRSIIDNESLKFLLLEKITNASHAELFILGYRSLRISNISRIVRDTRGMIRQDAFLDIEEINLKAFASIIETGKLAKQIQIAITEIDQNDSEDHLSFLEGKLQNRGPYQESTEIIKNAIKDSGAATIPTLLKVAVKAGKENVRPFIIESIKAAKNTKEEKVIYHALIETAQRKDLGPDHPSVALATEILLDPEVPEGAYYLLAEYAIHYRPTLGFPSIIESATIGITTVSKIILRLLRLISEILGAPPRVQTATVILRFLKEQAAIRKINLSDELLNSVINYLRNAQALSQAIRNLIEDYDTRLKTYFKATPGTAAGTLKNSKIARNILIQAIQILKIRELLEAEQLEEARGYAQGAAAFARRQNLFTDVTYIPGFLAYSIGNEPREKALEDLKTALRSDRGKGLFASMDIVQDILPNETYTDLGNIIKELEPEDLEPHVIVYGALLRSNKFSHERAKRILEGIEKDKDLWIKLLDLIGTRQFEEVHRRITAWLKENLS